MGEESYRPLLSEGYRVATGDLAGSKPQVANSRESLYASDSMLRHMPWDYFLRPHMANVVRNSFVPDKNFHFLADFLQGLSLRACDADEFRQYCVNEECSRRSTTVLGDKVVGKG
eukprot:Blabericola_migrator_1__12242@NODE_762_length_6620_cov_12_758736_g544_i0_p4_GENE_NODE_762_length_6620_cov_12_758736_g544_i0NODE_762_length_6620_cov_12_758736_g544_i0_p4_ORF_typecomplete_len115_score6_77_NODE_762_length_6620_cov_12_758736_g544_i033343678